MSEEYIEEGINGQWTDWKFEAGNYKKIYEQLHQENTQLKEENERLKINCNIGNENLTFYKEENAQLKSVLKEIREYIGRFDFEYLHQCYEHNLVETLENLLEIIDKEIK